MIKFISVIPSILLIGCISSSPTYKIDDVSDEIDGYRSILLTQNHLKPTLGEADVEFNVEKFIPWDEPGKVYYNIVLDVISLNGLFIKEGESLVLLVDGMRISFSGDGSTNDRDVLGSAVEMVKETAFYNITPKQLTVIANAKDVVIEITGSKFSVERKFIPENFTNLKRFITEYLD